MEAKAKANAMEAKAKALKAAPTTKKTKAQMLKAKLKGVPLKRPSAAPTPPKKSKALAPTPPKKSKKCAARPNFPKKCGKAVYHHTGKVLRSDTKSAWRVFILTTDRVDKLVHWNGNLPQSWSDALDLIDNGH